MASRLVAGALTALLLVAACDASVSSTVPVQPISPPAPTPTATMPVASPAASATVAPSPTSAALRWLQFGLVENTGLRVPLDYANPAAGTIILAVARRPAADRANRIGSLFINPGGPGGSGVQMVSDFNLSSSIPQAVLDRFDIVSWDPRGVGLSNAVACPTEPMTYAIEALEPQPTTATQVDAYRTVLDDVAAQCEVSQTAAVLPYLSTENTARDMEALRAALGEETISYWGWSYGTYLGYVYATMFPKRLRAAVFDGPVPPDRTLVDSDVTQAVGFDAALGHALDLCAKSKACPFHGGGKPGAAFDALLARLRTAPLAVGDRTLGAGEAMWGVLGWSYSPDVPGLMRALAEAEHGDGQALLASADYYHASVSPGSYFATSCLDNPHPVTASEIADALSGVRVSAPRFGPVILLFDTYGCLHWPVPADPYEVQGPPPALPVMIVVASAWDPATPPSGAPPLAAALGNAVIVTRDGLGHTSGQSATTNPCLRGVLEGYFLDLTVPAAETVCRDPAVSFAP
jgi:pimeloyl-ACP methyl ester carboxylesterase